MRTLSKHGRARWLLGCSLAALSLGAARAEQAQAGAKGAPAEQAETGAKGAQIEEIVVTARRTTERLQDAPLAVTAVGEKQLHAQNLSDSRDLVKLAPNLTFRAALTTKLMNFSVRGIGTFVSSDGFDQSVGVAFDGVSLARPGGSIADLVDIERVEILEGPQGMLFGRNASAGLVNIIPHKPVLGDFSLSGRMSAGSYGEQKLEATTNIPVGDTVALRLTGWKFRHDGYVAAPNEGRDIGVKDSEGQRLRLRWTPSDKLDVNLTAERTAADQDPAITTLRVFRDNTLGVRDYELGLGIKPAADNETTSTRDPLYNRGRSKALTFDASYDLGGPTISVLTSYRKISVKDAFDGEATSLAAVTQTSLDNIHYRQRSAEVRLNSSPDARLKYVVGAIYFDLTMNDVFTPYITGTVPVPAYVNARTDETSKHHAVFGELTYGLTPQLRVIAGGRLSKDKVSGQFDRSYAAPPPVIIPPFNGPGGPFGPYATSSSVSDSEPSYRLGLQWDVADDIMAYTTVSRGYKAAGLDMGLTITPATYSVSQLQVKPEIAMNYEAGLRSQFLDRRLTLNLTAWREVFTDFQTSLRLPSAVAVVLVTQNAKELRSEGVSAVFDAHLTDTLTLSGQGSYVDARYTDFKNAACYPRQPTAPAGTPLTPGLCVDGSQSLDGVSLAYSPKWRGNLTLRYERDHLVGDLHGFAQADLASQSKMSFSTDPTDTQKSYTTVNISAGVRPEGKQWSVSVYGANIFNEKFVAGTIAQINGAYYTNVTAYDARPRWGVALEFEF